jgi:hypothetical protein
MLLQRLWQRWLNRPATGARGRQTPRPRARLTVEPLEDRAVPASFAAATVPELIGAITAANQSPEADTITLAPGKTFTLTAVNNSYLSANGLPVIAAEGGSLTIVGNGDVIERATAKGTPEFRLLVVAPGASLTLQNLTLQGGVGLTLGGAVYNTGALALTGVTVQNNTARGLDGGYLLINGETAMGGGIYSSGALMVTDSTIRNNLAVGGKGGEAADGGFAFGGGVYLAGGTATMTGTTISGNEARGGPKGAGTWGSRKDPWGFYSQGDHGKGFGGGVCGSVYLDAFTLDHIINNKATTAFPNLFGSYTLLT